MNTLIGILLVAAVAFAAYARRSLGRRSVTRQKDRALKEVRKRELQQDRLDCLELARGLDRPLAVGPREETVEIDAPKGGE